MLWLQCDAQENLNLYLDIEQVEERQFRGRSFFAVSGICGDGRWEGEVLVEIGDEVTVTFVDDWLYRTGQNIANLDRLPLEQALIQTMSDARFCLESLPAPSDLPRRRILGCNAAGRWLPQRPRGWGEQLALPLGVAETSDGWKLRAA